MGLGQPITSPDVAGPPSSGGGGVGDVTLLQMTTAIEAHALSTDTHAMADSSLVEQAAASAASAASTAQTTANNAGIVATNAQAAADDAATAAGAAGAAITAHELLNPDAGVHGIIGSATEPVAPNTGDIWLDTTP